MTESSKPKVSGLQIVQKDIPRVSMKQVRVRVLNRLLRSYSVVSHGEVCNLPRMNMQIIARDLDLPLTWVEDIISTFFQDFSYFREFHKAIRIEWSNNMDSLNRRVRMFLRRVYRLAPVFDYDRAHINLGKLHQGLKDRSFWPKINTQVAIVIYVTDKLGANEDKLLQKNIRALCVSSAYAFHRTRNILNL